MTAAKNPLKFVNALFFFIHKLNISISLCLHDTALLWVVSVFRWHFECIIKLARYFTDRRVMNVYCIPATGINKDTSDGFITICYYQLFGFTYTYSFTFHCCTENLKYKEH